MRLSDTILTATQNLGRRKVRTVLTSIGVFVGIITIVTMVSLGVGIQKQITDTIKAFGLETVLVTPRIVRQPTGVVDSSARRRVEKPLNPQVVETFKTTPGVITAEVGLYLPEPPEMTATVEGKTFPMAFTDRNPAERIFMPADTLVAGRYPAPSPDARGVVFNQRVLTSVGYSPQQMSSLVGKPVTITITAPRGDKGTFNTVVAGVIEVRGRGGNDLGVADRADIKRWWFNDPNIVDTDGYDYVLLHTASINDATRIAGDVEAMEFESSTLQTFLDQVNRIFSIMQIMLSSIGLLALLVASIGIVNTMIMAIYERTREIGILKALGSTNGDVLRMFMVEAGMIGLLGGVVGVVLGWLLGLGLNRIIVDYLKREQIPIDAPFFVVTWELVGGALVFATLVGILAGLYPAFRAARLDPLAALRHE
jgi:ABC-type antimicrobial peptide transport system permease subunit